MREHMLILHFLGLSMGLGTTLAHAFLGMAVAKMTPEEATKFRMHSMVLSRMGHIGITLLLISGGYLITPYWSVLTSMPLLIVKLSLVFILILLIIGISVATKKARAGNTEAHLKKMETMGKLTLFISIAIVIIAVYIFH